MLSQLSYRPVFGGCDRTLACKFLEHCVFSATRGTPPMSCYTLFKGWLLLSPPIGFFALPVCKRPLYLTALLFLSYSVCRLQRLGHALSAIAVNFKVVVWNGINLLSNHLKTSPLPGFEPGAFTLEECYSFH